MESNTLVSYDVYSSYEFFKDYIKPLLTYGIRLSMPLSDLPKHGIICVQYASDNTFSEIESLRYYEHIVQQDELILQTGSDRVSTFPPTNWLFITYWRTVNRLSVNENSWIRAMIDLSQGAPSETGCIRCLLESMTTLFRVAGGVASLVPFKFSFNTEGQRTYRTPSDSRRFQSYCESNPIGHVVLLDFYSDGATMSKYGTQSASFKCVRFPNLDKLSEQWFTVAITPISRTLPSSLPYAHLRKLKLQLMHGFIFLVFGKFINDSYSGFAVNGKILLAHIGMII